MKPTWEVKGDGGQGVGAAGRGEEAQVSLEREWLMRLRPELETGGCEAGRVGDGSLGRQGVCAQGTPSRRAQPRAPPSASFRNHMDKSKTVPAFCDHSSCPINLQGKNFAC